MCLVKYVCNPKIKVIFAKTVFSSIERYNRASSVVPRGNLLLPTHFFPSSPHATQKDALIASETANNLVKGYSGTVHFYNNSVVNVI